MNTVMCHPDKSEKVHSQILDFIMCSCFSFIQGPLGAAGPPGFPGGPGPKVSVMPLPVASQRGSRLG